MKEKLQKFLSLRIRQFGADTFVLVLMICQRKDYQLIKTRLKEKAKGKPKNKKTHEKKEKKRNTGHEHSSHSQNSNNIKR